MSFPSAKGHPQHQKPLGAYLIEAGLLSAGQVEVILADQRISEMPFGEIATTRGWVKQQTIEYLMQKVILPERALSNSASQRSQISKPSLPPISTHIQKQTYPQQPTPQTHSPLSETEVPWVG